MPLLHTGAYNDRSQKQLLAAVVDGGSLSVVKTGDSVVRGVGVLDSLHAPKVKM